MGVNLYPFLTSGPTIWEKLINILSLFCWLFGGGMYIYGTVQAFHWLLVFPNPNALCGAIWMTHISLRLVSLWLPMGHLLIHWRLTNACFLILYVAGATIAILLSIVSVVLITDYDDETGEHLRLQYFNLIKPSLEKGGFPASLSHSVTLDSCCSWYGPTDFFESFDGMTDRLNENPFAEGVSKCYGDAFSYKDGKPQDGAGDAGRISGCSVMYTQSAVAMMNFIASSAIVTFITCPLFIALVVYGSTRLSPRRTAPAPTNMMQQLPSNMTQSQSQLQSQGAMSPAGSPGVKSDGNIDALLPDY